MFYIVYLRSCTIIVEQTNAFVNQQCLDSKLPSTYNTNTQKLRLRLKNKAIKVVIIRIFYYSIACAITQVQ